MKHTSASSLEHASASLHQQLENASSTPLYLQLAARLREDIESGQLPPGSRLATENELSGTYHVSRVTVRKALALLEEKKYIDRKVGKGTYVTEQKIKRTFAGNVSSFTQMCSEMGLKASARTIHISLETPSDEERQIMHIPTGEKILKIVRIRLADSQPVMIEKDLFPEAFDFLFTEDLNNHSMYELIREQMKVTFVNASRTIDIIFADAGEAGLLKLKSGYPLLRISSVTEDADGQYVTISEQLCVGDKFRLQV